MDGRGRESLTEQTTTASTATVTINLARLLGLLPRSAPPPEALSLNFDGECTVQKEFESEK